MTSHRVPSTLAALAVALLLAGCGSVGQRHETPKLDVPVAFKEGEGVWLRAQAPAQARERGPWWQAFDDAVLAGLLEQVQVSNQNVAAAAAAYAQAQAITRQQRSSLLPVVGLNAGADRSGSQAGARSSFQVSVGGSWEPDLWGRLRTGVEGARSGEQASAADLAAARLSAQGELAISYFGLREADAQRAVLAETLAGYRRSLEIVKNRYEAGIVARTDVLQAETQLANAQADMLALQQQRATFEHAIAVLVGMAPANFSLAADPRWQARVPGVPEVLPSTLLLRRPDIAAAERRVAQANAQIGIAEAARFPSIQLTGSSGRSAASISDLFKASSLVWALGASLAQTLLDGGGIRAQVEGARAAHEGAAARYRQAVLTAFQDVEDQLVAMRVLQQQQVLRQQAAQAAELVEQQVMNRYRAGQVNYTEVVTAQASAASARRALIQVQSDRQVAAVALVQAVGGGWEGLPP